MSQRPVLLGQVLIIGIYFIIGIGVFVSLMNCGKKVLKDMPWWIRRRYYGFLTTCFECPTIACIVLWPCYGAWVLGYFIAKNIYLIKYANKSEHLAYLSLSKTFKL